MVVQKNAHSSHRIHVRKEALKFSSAHMTVFPGGKKERLHGHNYVPTLSLVLKGISFSEMVSFSEIKAAMKKVSNEWDEKFLLAEDCEFLKIISKNKKEIEFKLCGARYVLPLKDVVFLPIDNVTTENLAQVYFKQWKSSLPKSFPWKNIVRIEVMIEEIGGQGASYFWEKS